MKKNIICRALIKILVYLFSKIQQQQKKKKGINYQNLKVNKNYKINKNNFQIYIFDRITMNIILIHFNFSHSKEKNEKKKNLLASSLISSHDSETKDQQFKRHR